MPPSPSPSLPEPSRSPSASTRAAARPGGRHPAATCGRPGGRDAGSRRPDRFLSGATAYCPYCASLLQPPPDATRRCPRCRQRIVVRQVGTRTVYLAEAALPVFEAERRRAMNAERWGRERDRWLDLARESGAAADRVPHRPGSPSRRPTWPPRVPSTCRPSTARSGSPGANVDGRRQPRSATTRRSSCSGSPARRPHRRTRSSSSTARAWRRSCTAIGEVAKDAELRGASCCESCRVDEGRVVRIAEELRSPRLPHRGCPKGLCRCRWFISARDQAFLSEFLRRQARANRRLTAPPTEPGRMTRSRELPDRAPPASASRVTRGRMAEAAAIESRAAHHLRMSFSRAGVTQLAECLLPRAECRGLELPFTPILDDEAPTGCLPCFGLEPRAWMRGRYSDDGWR